jgi:hypothetical protein
MLRCYRPIEFNPPASLRDPEGRISLPRFERQPFGEDGQSESGSQNQTPAQGFRWR